MTEARKYFDESIRLVFSSQGSTCHPLFVFVKRTLKQLRLSRAYEPTDILTEAYARGVKQIEAGQPIDSPIPWLRKTSYYVMLEFRRQQNGLPIPLLDEPPSENSNNTVSHLLSLEDLLVMRRAFERLDSASQVLLHHRLIQGQSWREVSQALVTAGEPESNEGALRLRGFKAVKKLKQLYEEMRLEMSVEWVENSDSNSLLAED